MVNRLKKTFKDNSREKLVNTLTNLGIKGEMLERGAMEEKIGDKLKSFGATTWQLDLGALVVV